ncbi:unnamed protein product [Fraxinus pennsylvanica]|uniref:Uncharacterized protein n=1 Tax=Fraxinus pennsylvanica TaxID=56036 RepID=A0AAD2AFR9_9LAMI|nr:unnamed protein product [Fraxinus pennsylvanica]
MSRLPRWTFYLWVAMEKLLVLQIGPKKMNKWLVLQIYDGDFFLSGTMELCSVDVGVVAGDGWVCVRAAVVVVVLTVWVVFSVVDGGYGGGGVWVATIMFGRGVDSLGCFFSCGWGLWFWWCLGSGDYVRSGDGSGGSGVVKFSASLPCPLVSHDFRSQEKYWEEKPGQDVPLVKPKFYGGPWRVMRGDMG